MVGHCNITHINMPFKIFLILYSNCIIVSYHNLHLFKSSISIPFTTINWYIFYQTHYALNNCCPLFHISLVTFCRFPNTSITTSSINELAYALCSPVLDFLYIFCNSFDTFLWETYISPSQTINLWIFSADVGRIMLLR